MIQEATFIGSYPALKDCPKSDKPEFAFIGRSNVGKSSLINMICGRKALAKVSGTPGKTQSINFFLINDRWHLVDLPGYGYARVSKTTRGRWEGMIETYLRRRDNLQCIFVLIDSNIPPQKIDLEFIGNLGEWQLPFVCVFTKSDRVSQREVQANIAAFKKELLKTWEALPQMFVTSSEKGIGRADILEFINAII